MSPGVTSEGNTATALLGVGQVQHTRLRPARHRFSYPTCFLLLPMRTLRASPESALLGLRRNQWGLLSFHDRDHGDGREDSLSWLEECLAREGITDADGEVWLHSFPRMLGYVFKPVSFWYCHRHDNTLAAIVVEVNNTFGERHCYLLSGPQLVWGRELHASKVFHVSPFCSVEGGYRFRFMRTHAELSSEDQGQTVARIEYDDSQGPLLLTSVSGQLAPATAQRLRAAFFAHPLMTLTLIARIHWHALLLLFKRVPFHRKPEPPRTFVTR